VGVRPGPLRRPEEIAGLARGPDDPRRQARRDVGDDPDRGRVRRDGALLDDPRPLLAAPVRRLEAAALGPAGARPRATLRGHRADAAVAFLPAPTGAVEASFFSWAFVRFSVPTSVSL